MSKPNLGLGNPNSLTNLIFRQTLTPDKPSLAALNYYKNVSFSDNPHSLTNHHSLTNLRRSTFSKIGQVDVQNKKGKTMSHWPYNFDAYDEYQREEKYLFMRSKGNNAPRKQRVNKCKCVGGDFKDQDFCGMYCAILTVNSVVVCAAIFRVFGEEVAESPLLLQRSIVKERI